MNEGGSQIELDRLLEIKKNEHYLEKLCSVRGIVPFIGAGVSVTMYPMWRTFLEGFDLLPTERKMLTDLLDDGKYEEAASFISSLSEKIFTDTVKATFSPSRIAIEKFTDTLLLLPELVDDLIVTTNLDEVLEKVWDYQEIPFPSIITPDHEDQFNEAITHDEGNILVKLHGTVRESTKYVITKEQYDSCYGADSANKIDLSKPFPRDLGRLLNARTLLFIGSSLKSDRVLHLLQEINKQNKHITHFALLSLEDNEDSVILRERKLAEYGIVPIWFPKNDFPNIAVLLDYIIKKKQDNQIRKLKRRKKVDVIVEAPNTLPRTIPQLFGRNEEIKFVNDLITKNKEQLLHAVVISSFDGMPAVGKTTLVVRIAHLLTSEYPDAQLYIDCYGYTAGQTPLTSEQILDSLLLSLGVTAQMIPQDYADKLTFWRNKLSYKKVIIVFDNVKFKTQIDALIPSSRNTLVLITSRNRLTDLFDAQHLQINVLKESSSIDLLKEISKNHDDKYLSLFASIAKKYGNLPLALQIIASRIRGRSMKYIKRLLEIDRPLSSLKTSESNAVYESFNISYLLLDDEQKSIIQIASITPGASFTSASCAALLKIETHNAFEALEALYDQRLIEEIGEDRYRLHDLIRDFSREKYAEFHSEQEKNTALKRLIDFYSACILHCNKTLYPDQFGMDVNKTVNGEIENLPLGREDVFVWLKDEIENILACLQIAANENWSEEYLQLSHVLSHYIRRCLSSWRVIEIQQAAYDFSVKMGDETQIAMSLTELALAQHQAGEFSTAIKTFNDAELRWRALGQDAGLAYALANHGFTLERLGEYPAALIILKEALSINKKIENMYGAAFTLNSKGAVYWRMEEYKTAKTIFEEAIKIRRELEDYLGLGSTINNLAFTYLKMGNVKKARIGFEESLLISQSYSDYYGQAVTINNFGYTEIVCGNYEEAIKHALDAKNIAYIVGDEYQTGRSFDVQGKAYLKMENKGEAKKCLTEALKIFEKMKVPEADEVREILRWTVKVNPTKSE
jgi:tetratricopeptide (TPR) repeat protein